MTGIRGIQALRGLDYSLPESIAEFKKVFDGISKADADHTIRDAQFNYIIRNVGISSKEYTALYAAAMNLKDAKPLPSYMTVTYGYQTNMYNLDMCSDWDINDVMAVVDVGLNLNISTYKIFDFVVKHKLTDDYGPIIERFAERGALNEVSKIEWAKYLGLGVKTPSLNSKAVECYKAMGFKPKAVGKTDIPGGREKAITEYIIQAGFDKIDDYCMLAKKTYPEAERSLKYQILFNVWLAKIEKLGFTSEEDQRIFKEAITNKVLNPREYFYINANVLHRVLEQETISAGYDLLKSLDSELLVAFAAHPWAIPVVEPTLHQGLKYNAAVLMRILSTNSNYGTPGVNLYSDKNTLSVFMETVSRNSKMAYYNICRWLPKATNIDDMKETPITQVALATVLLMLKRENKINKKELRKINTVLPGIETEEGRKELIEKYLPKANTMLKLESLYSDLNLISMVAMKVMELEMSAPSAEGIEF